MSASADLTAPCPHCGQDATYSVTLALGEAYVVDGRHTLSPSVGITGTPHLCAPDSPDTIDPAAAEPAP